MLLEKSAKLMSNGYVCDSCIGRQFARLLKKSGNAQRGRSIRDALAMEADAGNDRGIDHKNLFGYAFSENDKIDPKKPGKCIICGSLMSKTDSIAERIVKRLKNVEFDTFLLGTRLNAELGSKEEQVWETVGFEWCETLKAELNREIGKKVSEILGKPANFDNPDINILLDLSDNSITVRKNPIFIYGRYKKLKPGIPQTKWPCRDCKGAGKIGNKICPKCEGRGKLYKTSIQEIIEKPILKKTKGSSTSFHGAGREDIDAVCLDWRPFVIEISEPSKRKINFREIEKAVNMSKAISVSKLSLSSKAEVRRLKSEKSDKTYGITVSFEKPVKEERLKALISEFKERRITQFTPQRVLHRKGEKRRQRSVRKVKYSILSKKKVRFELKVESGLYVKELVSGDSGRTRPNFSGFLESPGKVDMLEVLKIHKSPKDWK